MISITSTVRTLIEENSSLLYGFKNGLLNATQVARHLKPKIEANLHRKVSLPSIAMAITRLSNKLSKHSRQKSFPIDNITVVTDLRVLSFYRTTEVREDLNKLHRAIQKTKADFTLTEGTTEIMVILRESDLSKAKQIVRDKPIYTSAALTALHLRFDITYLLIPGFLHQIFEQLALRSISVMQLASTATELILYVSRLDGHKAFETLFSNLERSKS